MNGKRKITGMRFCLIGWIHQQKWIFISSDWLRQRWNPRGRGRAASEDWSKSTLIPSVSWRVLSVPLACVSSAVHHRYKSRPFVRKSFTLIWVTLRYLSRQQAANRAANPSLPPAKWFFFSKTRREKKRTTRYWKRNLWNCSRIIQELKGYLEDWLWSSINQGDVTCTIVRTLQIATNFTVWALYVVRIV